jgi:prepilin-type N-terminal cleavage/methylation domain-containing protein
VSRLRDEQGFTLHELLTAIAMSTIILLGAFGLLDTVMQRTGETQARVDATQRARQALDVMTRQLRSQVCLGTAPAVADASPNSVTFYTDMSDGSAALRNRIEKRVLTYDPATRRILEAIYPPTGTDPITYPAAPAMTRELARNVVPEKTSMFRYFAFTEGTTTTAPEATVELTNPPEADRQRLVKIEIAFEVKGGRSGELERGGITLRDDVYVRAADPNTYTPNAPDPANRAPRPICA